MFETQLECERKKNEYGQFSVTDIWLEGEWLKYRINLMTVCWNVAAFA